MKRIITLLIVIGIIIAAGFGYSRYKYIYSPSVPQARDGEELYVYTGTTLAAFLSKLEKEKIVSDIKATKWVSRQMDLNDASVKPGRYILKGGWSNYELLSNIRSGIQSPLMVVLRSERSLENLASVVSSQLEADSVSLVNAFTDPVFMDSRDISPEDILSYVIPNSYEFYWNTNAEDFRDRILKEHKNFWESDSRLAKAKSIGLNPEEVYTLASIIEKETARAEERPTIAGVYLNRLERNIPLQADPTVIYANQDYTIRRVLNSHLEIDSPYNTYKYSGLPPGPISMASISSIDAVLNAEDHNYIFFCARPDDSGLHQFASTLSEHNRNARRFHNWLNSRGIR